MDAQAQLAQFKEEFDPVLTAYLDARIDDAQARDAFTAEGLARCRDMILAGGKRLRPALTVWAYEGSLGTDRAAILHAAMSVELIHAFLLVHDDIMDRDAMRHGAPTLHEHYRRELAGILSPEEAAHAGNSLALVFGDMLNALGNHALFSAPFDKERLFVALTHLQDVIGYTCVGQLKDVMAEYTGSASVDDILTMYEHKTARYTIESPMVLGAILAGAEDSAEHIAAFARPLGVAFQIRDDIIGLYGDAHTIGKPVGSDVAEGKITLLVALAREMADADARAQLEELLGTADISARNLAAFRDIITTSGAREAAEERAERLIHQSIAALDALAFTPDVRKRLLALATYLTQRRV